MAEQDDGDNWTLGTLGTRTRTQRALPFNYTADHGHGQIIEDELGPPKVSAAPSEHAQLWFYRSWSEWIAASSWGEYREIHSPAPEGFI
jgi:3-phenylpropionate/trans-cinnamate dioxygenase alpha subunit